MLLRCVVCTAIAPLAFGQAAEGTCVPLTANLDVTGDIVICPGAYALDDPENDGVIRVRASGVTIEMEGVVLAGSQMQGFGIVADGFDDVTIRRGTIRGFKAAVFLSNGSGHLVEHCELSHNRKRPTFNSGADFLAVWPDLPAQLAADQIGNGLLLSNVSGASLRYNRCTDSQNGIGLFLSNEVELIGNVCDSNEGWGIHLHRSSRNVIAYNSADHNWDHESTWCHTVQQDGCDTAALLVIKDSNDNLVVGNSLRDGGDGVFSAAQEGGTHWGADRNVYAGNDCSLAKHIGLESTFSDHNEFRGNVADNCGRYGFWLGYSRNAVVEGNQIRGNAFAGISNESVDGILYDGNEIALNRVGVELRRGAFTLLDQDSRDHYFAHNHVHDNLDRGFSIIDTHEVVIRENTIRSNAAGNLRFAVSKELELEGVLQVTDNNLVAGGAAYNVKNEQRSAVDLTDNWWGTTDPAQIAATIIGREQYAIVPPHRLPTLEIVFQDSAGVATLRRVVNERAGDADDIAPAGAGLRSNNWPHVYFGRDLGGAEYVAGFRFSDIYVPPGATILSARLLLIAVVGPPIQLDLCIFGEASGDAAPFEAGSMPAARTRTSARVNWRVSAPWNADQQVATPDLTPLVLEALGQPGWQSGNALAFIVANRSPSSGSRGVYAFDFEGYATLPNTPAEFRRYRRHRFAKLEIEYDDGSGPMALERELAAGSDDADTCLNCNEVYVGFLGGSVTAGFRFDDVRVPLGASLLGARLRLPTDGTYTNSINVRLRGEKLADAPTYSSLSLPASRPKTVNFAQWPISQTWTYLEWHATPELTSPVAEVLAQAAWQPGNALAIDVQNSGSTEHRRVWGFDRDPRTSPHDFPEIGATPFVPFRTGPVGQ